MMAYLFEHAPGFSHTIVVDKGFDLFSRAWCIAEIVQGSASGIKQRLVLHSAESVDEHYVNLADLDVRDCKASRPEDKDAILGKITDIAAFNMHLQELMSDAEGLFSHWADGEALASTVGRCVLRVASIASARSRGEV